MKVTTRDLHSDMSQWSAADCAYAYRHGIATPLEVVSRSLQMAETSDAIFIAITHELALQQAAAATTRLHTGIPCSPLDGVAVAWKDLFDLEGSITTAGSTFFKQPAIKTAALIDAANQAGMIHIGKTNLSEFAYSGLGLNPHYGTPTHALWPGKYVPGGSSSGSAIAVANHIVPLAIGSDTGGSVRIPAAFNGITGYRASRRRYSQSGMFGLASSLDTIGPLARCLEDCLLFDRTIQQTAQLPDTPARPAILVPQEIVEDPLIDDVVLAAFLQKVGELKDAGYHIKLLSVAAIAQTKQLIAEQGWLGAIEAYALHRTRLQGQAQRFDPRVRVRLLRSADIPAWQYIFLQEQRRALMTRLKNELGTNILATPTVAHTAPTLASMQQDEALFHHTNLATLSLPMIGSFLDMPAISMPSGTAANGQFTGIQFAMTTGSDDALLAACIEIEKLLQHRP